MLPVIHTRYAIFKHVILPFLNIKIIVRIMLDYLSSPNAMNGYIVDTLNKKWTLIFFIIAVILN